MPVANKLQDLKNQQKKLAEVLTAKGVPAVATEKYSSLVDKVAQIEELRGEERTLDQVTRLATNYSTFVQLKYRSPENFVPYPYIDSTKTDNGITFTINTDRSITVTGTTSAPMTGADFTVATNIALDKSIQYRYQPNKTGSGAEMTMYAETVDGYSRITSEDATFENVETILSIHIEVLPDSTVNATFLPQVIKTSEKTVTRTLDVNVSGNPTIDLTTLTVTRCGKNLWQNTNTTFPSTLSYDSNTQTYTIGTGTIGYAFTAHKLDNPIPVGTVVTISAYFQSGKGIQCAFGGYHRTGGKSWQGYLDIPANTDMTGQMLTATFTTTETVEEFVVFHNTGGNVEEAYVFQVQYEISSAATAYEPYQGQEYTPDSDGNVKGITALAPVTTLSVNSDQVVFAPIIQHTPGSSYISIYPSSGKNGITRIQNPVIDQYVDANIAPENIKKDVSILGVTGTYKGDAVPAEVEYTYDSTNSAVTIIL